MENLKKELRNKILAARNQLTKDELKAKSDKIFEKLKSLDEFKRSKWILCFVDFRNEVMTHGFIEQCLKTGKKIAVPVIVDIGDRKKDMIASEIHDIGSDLEPGFSGIEEPKKDRISRVDPRGIDLVVVPGLAFDGLKNRLGYGAGYYDRYLARVRPDCSKIAVAFDLQIVDSVPVQEYDLPMDKIITESRIIE
ncbi:MAG: 5-formyltetrahydrofolate cyclo-ligase [Clostridiales bacterium]|nr:5-formyltetrahydrofolate cyclo-ligase [Eubacteriales bacterium]MDH7565650.1 5-formyltetrahydrofolate cyclo-ligase [Clostridiales bacterium]